MKIKRQARQEEVKFTAARRLTAAIRLTAAVRLTATATANQCVIVSP